MVKRLLASLIDAWRRRAPRPVHYGLVHVTRRSDLPRALGRFRVYAVGHPAKWVVFACPCGRGHEIALNLANSSHPRWSLHTTTHGPTVSPSVDATWHGFRCHYWIRDGRVRWC
jgi:hypothetical protein